MKPPEMKATDQSEKSAVERSSYQLHGDYKAMRCSWNRRKEQKYYEPNVLIPQKGLHNFSSPNFNPKGHDPNQGSEEAATFPYGKKMQALYRYYEIARNGACICACTSAFALLCLCTSPLILGTMIACLVVIWLCQGKTQHTHKNILAAIIIAGRRYKYHTRYMLPGKYWRVNSKALRAKNLKTQEHIMQQWINHIVRPKYWFVALVLWLTMWQPVCQIALGVQHLQVRNDIPFKFNDTQMSQSDQISVKAQMVDLSISNSICQNSCCALTELFPICNAERKHFEETQCNFSNSYFNTNISKESMKVERTQLYKHNCKLSRSKCGKTNPTEICKLKEHICMLADVSSACGLI